MGTENTSGCYVRIDVSKDTLDVYARPTGQSWKVENRNFSSLVNKFKRLNPELVVLEATSGYGNRYFACPD